MDDEQRVTATTSIADAIAAARGTDHVPVTFESCDGIEGPFFHGTNATFEPGALVEPGHPSNHDEGRTSNHVYFAALPSSKGPVGSTT